MSASQPNSDTPAQAALPGGLTEADLMDLADGVLPRDREAIVLNALRKHPEIGLLVKQFRADATAVESLGPVRTPAGLAEGIESRLEAAALRDLASESRHVPRPIPISTVTVREPSVLRVLTESPWTRRLATAASLAIVVGLGAFGVRSIWNALPTKPIARTTPNPAPEATPSSPVAPPAIEVATTGTTTSPDASPAIVGVAAASPTDLDELTSTRAARLAAEGRLAIIVRTTVATGSLKRLDALARARGGDWHTVALDAPAQYAALLTPSADPAPAPPQAPGTAIPTAIAGSDSGSRPVAPQPIPPSPALPALHPTVKAIYTVEVTPGEQPLQSLIRSITDTLPEGATISLRVLPQPILTPIALDPESVLWWNSPSGRWSRRGQVPVVVEGLD